MRVRLVREPSRDGATLGVLFVDGRFQCFTCEDQIREVTGQPVETWKVPGKTAIPQGVYTVAITWSERFQKPMPLVCDVPGFTGIRIHPGNTEQDTAGCILPGLVRGDHSVGGSTQAFNALFNLIKAHPPVTLRIENPA